MRTNSTRGKLRARRILYPLQTDEVKDPGGLKQITSREPLRIRNKTIQPFQTSFLHPNRRATLYYLKNDYTHSLEDIRQVLIREPRHFGALAGLGMIMQDIGDEKRALEAFRKALAVNPHLEKVPELVKTLSDKVEGRDI